MKAVDLTIYIYLYILVSLGEWGSIAEGTRRISSTPSISAAKDRGALLDRPAARLYKFYYCIKTQAAAGVRWGFRRSG